MYKNNCWKWIQGKESTLPKSHIFYYFEYKIKNIISFSLTKSPNLDSSYQLTISANSKIQKWILQRLNISQTRYKTIKFEGSELEQFLDELDNMVEILYAK